MSFETLVLSNLVYNEKYGRKVIPFLKDEYFSSEEERVVFKLIDSYVREYNSFPSKEALVIELSHADNINEHVFNESKEILSNLSVDDSTDIEWLLDKTEKFCQEKALHNAIRNSIQILDNKSNLSKGTIPQLLSDALAVSFDTHIGHDFIEDFIERFEFYHKVEYKIPFDLEFFNKITRGGVSKKTLNIILAGCVHPDTKVKVRIRKKE
jgi:hypothetical protein